MKAYVISDTHFNHEAIVKYCNRPEYHKEMMMGSIKEISHKNNCLIHLGDFALGNEAEWSMWLRKNWKGRMVLVMGNHDSKIWSWYMENGWDFACDAFRLKYCGKIIMFSHCPQPWDGVWEINVHGHLHNLGHRDNEFKELKQWHRLYAPELMDYRPIELSKFIQTAEKKTQ